MKKDFKKLFIIVNLVWMLLFSGCISYTDKNGATHFWGFNHVIVKETQLGGYRTQALAVETIGLGYVDFPRQSGLVLGYYRADSLETDAQGSAVILRYDKGKPVEHELLPVNGTLVRP